MFYLSNFICDFFLFQDIGRPKCSPVLFWRLFVENSAITIVMNFNMYHGVCEVSNRDLRNGDIITGTKPLCRTWILLCYAELCKGKEHVRSDHQPAMPYETNQERINRLLKRIHRLMTQVQQRATRFLEDGNALTLSALSVTEFFVKSESPKTHRLVPGP